MAIKAKKVKESQANREKRIFKDQPIWKSVLQMSAPAMIAMLVFGLYNFADSILSIQLANDNYEGLSNRMPGVTSKDLVRLFMAGTGPITTFLMAITLLFGVGVARRVSVNIGSGNEERAIKTMKTTMQTGLVVSVILIPILMFAAKPWIHAQFDGDPRMASVIADKSFDYVWIIVMSAPIMMFNQISTSLLRTEARNKEAILATVLPLFVNLFCDWLFMGPLGMGVEGSAWATFLSYIITALLMAYFITKSKGSRLIWKNLFGRKNFQLITLVGVLLVGISPFLRNMAQSITQTFEMNKIQGVSQEVYGSHMIMTSAMTGVFPLFGLFFPIMFGFVQAGSPLAAYSFGAKDMKRVRGTIIWVAIFSFITGLIIYLISTFALFEVLSSWLGTGPKNYDYKEINALLIKVPTGEGHKKLLEIQTWATKINHGNANFHFSVDMVRKSKIIYGIMLAPLPLFGVMMASMVLFGSTDRVLMSIFASSLRGIILLFPFLIIFAHIAKGDTGNMIENVVGNHGPFAKEYLFWWFYPALLTTTTIIVLIGMIWTFRVLRTKELVTLDTRIETAHTWARARRQARADKRIARKQ